MSNKKSERIVSREVFEKILEKAKNNAVSNQFFKFPDLLVNMSDALEIFKSDENCNIVLSLSKEPTKYLNIIAAVNSNYFEKIENLKVIKDLKFSDYTFFNESSLSGELGDLFLDLALEEKKNKKKGKIEKIKKESWITKSDERIFKAINAGVFNCSDLLMVKWDIENQAHINFIKNELIAKNTEIFTYVPNSIFKANELSAAAVVLIIGQNFINKDVKEILKFAKENMGNEKFEASLNELIKNEHFNYITLSHIFEKEFMNKFKKTYLESQIEKYQNNFLSGNNLDIKDVEKYYENKINSYKDLMFFYNNYQERFANSLVLVDKINFEKVWEESSSNNELSKLVSLLNINSVLTNKFQDFISENKEMVLNGLKNNTFEITEPMSKILEATFKNDYIKEYFKNEKAIVDNQCFRDSEWVLSNMDIQSFHDALLKTVGSYKNVGMILAYDQYYDDVSPRYAQFNGLSEAEFVNKFISNILKKPSKSLRM